LRIAWWSPLPPQNSGISDYSFDLLTELTTRIAVIAVVRDDVVSLVHAPAGVPVLGASKYLAGVAGRCNLDIYQMGNDSGSTATCMPLHSPHQAFWCCTTWHSSTSMPQRAEA